MPPDVLELLQRHGVVRRRALVKAGLSRRALARALDRGDLRLLAPDVLALSGDPAVGEELAAAASALDGTVSGASAALRRGWALVAEPDLHQVTVDRDRGGRELPGVRIRRRDLRGDEREQRNGTWITSALRTAMDCARDLPRREAVVAVDSALRSAQVSLEQLRAALAALPPGPGRRRVEEVLSLCDAQSGSVLESVCRLLLVDGGLPPEATQLVIRRGREVVGRVDFAWTSRWLVVEVDGFEFHSDRASYRRDRRRSTALSRAGWVVLRFSWEDVMSSPTWVLDSVREALGPCRRCAA